MSSQDVKVKAKEVISVGAPNETGRRLAEALFEHLRATRDGGSLTVDTVGLPAGLLITSFFNSFLQRVFEEEPELLATAKAVDWTTEFPFQKKSLELTVERFTPREVHAEAL